MGSGMIKSSLSEDGESLRKYVVLSLRMRTLFAHLSHQYSQFHGVRNAKYHDSSAVPTPFA